MAKVLVCYYSRTGNTRRMAEAVAEAAGGVDGVTVECRPVEKVRPRELLDYDAILMGSPTYYGTMAAQIKKLLDESVTFHGQLEGKVGGAFASSANLGGGTETTILDILNAQLVHGMVVRGFSSGAHYGPVAVGEPGERALRQCALLGQGAAELAVKLHG